MAEQHSAQSTPPAPAPETYSRLVRARKGRILAGVCSGIGRYTGVDPVVLRVGFALLVLANGQGILLYIAAALLMPGDPFQASAVERVLRRRFDAGAVLALLGGLLCLGVVLTSASEGLSDNALTVVTVFALVLLVAHGRKVDLVRVARTMPERMQGHPFDTYTQPPEPVSFDKPPAGADTLPAGMIDLATLGSGASASIGPVPGPGPVAAGPPGMPGRLRSAKRTSPVLTQISLLTAIIAAAAMIPVAAGHSPARGAQLMMAPALAAVALGLLVAGWYGRARGLATVGTLLTFSLLTTTVVAEVPQNARFGDVEWRPVDAAQSEQTYRVGAGEGRLDLSSLPLAPGGRIKVNAELLLGSLHIIVPATARVEIDARVGLGDISVDRRIHGGPNAKINEVLEPEAPGGAAGQSPPVIELRIRAKVGDVTVNRD